jgi:hypothetical protein
MSVRIYMAKSKRMTKDDYKQELMYYISTQLDKLTVKQIRVLISSYARR